MGISRIMGILGILGILGIMGMMGLLGIMGILCILGIAHSEGAWEVQGSSNRKWKSEGRGYKLQGRGSYNYRKLHSLTQLPSPTVPMMPYMPTSLSTALMPTLCFMVLGQV